MPPLYIDIAVPLAVDKLFTYAVPDGLRYAVKPGVRAVVPFGKRTIIGLIATLNPQSSIRNPKFIHDVLDAEPILSGELLHLAQWISEYYFAPLGEVLKTMLVQGTLRAGKRKIKLATGDIQSILSQESVSRAEKEILKSLMSSRTASITQLQKIVGVKSIYTTLNKLEREGYVTITEDVPQSKFKPKYELVVGIDNEWKQRWREWLKEAGSRETNPHIARQIDAIQKLSEKGDSSVPVAEFLRSDRISLSTVRTLKRKKLVSIAKREIVRTTEYDLYESSLGAQNIILNSHQQKALEEIRLALDSGTFHAFLLHGVTGSGKTQVYIETIRETLKLGKTAIVLVPEISLTPQIVRRFKHHFGEEVIVFHSKMSPGERYDAWRLAHDGRCSIVIGPRSAIFAPLANLGIVVVDEEQEAAYKQFDQTPRYHARDVAIMRASHANAVVVLGSATPALESYANAVNGKYVLLDLPERVDNAKLPQIEIIDMTAERRRELGAFRETRKEEFKTDAVAARLSKRKFEFDTISDLLKEKIEDRLRKKEGIILLQNRRGFAPFIECPDCGHVEMCDNCSVTLTHHRAKNHLRCHYCGLVKQPPEVCPACKSADIQYRGFGTQRVETDLKNLFPTASIIRMDLDTTSRKGSHDMILKRFSEGDVDILLGTQMVAKGLDFSRVTLVGVISADTQMLLPDFRSAERTFQLLTQVAGRAGRSALAGEVVIQTFQPQHYSLKHVIVHDFKSFYAEELSYRSELHYPPDSRLVLIEFKGKQDQQVMRHASKFAELVKESNSHLMMLGPAPPAIARLKGMYRWHIVIKDLKTLDPAGKQLHATLKRTLESYRASALGKSRSVQVVIDVDPIGMM